MSKIEGGLRTKSGHTLKPLVSVITVVRNGGAYLEKTILSIIKAKTTEMEYIIVDGASTDDTLDYIKKHDAAIDYWISERDKDIFDAVNKGIRLARGKYFLVINLGDTLIDFPWDELLDCERRGGDIAMFRVQMSNGKIHRSHLNYKLKFSNTVHHQGAFYATSLQIQYDNQRFPTFADFDSNQMLWKQNKKFIEYDRIICNYTLDGSSSDPKKRPEYFAVIRKNFGSVWEAVGRLYIRQFEVRHQIKAMFKSNEKE